MNKFSSGIARIFQSKRFLMIFSLIVSFIIWYSLTIYYNPVSTRPIKNVPIMFDTSESVVAGKGLEIVSYDVDSVEVVITGKTANVQRITPADITVTPSMSSVTGPGTYTVPLNYSKAMLSDFDVISVKPDTVTVTVDTVTSRDFAVSAVANGATAPDGLICESPVITDAAYRNITVSGAQAVIEKISSVVAKVDVNEQLSTTTEFEGEIVLLDSDGNAVDKNGLDLSFDKASITVSISKIKTVGINVVFENGPKVSPCSYNLCVATVSVIGDPKIIDTLEKVDLLPIDHGQIVPGNSVFNCKLNLPAGIRVNDGLESVTVSFDTSKLRTATLKVQKLNYTNFNTSLGAVKLNSPVSVTVYGLKSDISKLTSSNLTLNVSLGSYDSKGEYTVPATVTVADGIDSVWVSTYNKEYVAYITIG